MIKWISGILVSAVLIMPAVAQDELQIRDIEKGIGEEANVGETVVVHYTGWLMDGTKFDSSLDRGEPFSFTLGERKVIPGWEKGVEGMQVGGKRELIIPPDMAYGSRGAGGIIPPDATLKFEIELLEVKAKKFSALDGGRLEAEPTEGTATTATRFAGEWRVTAL
ncbi:FKBP-type peptidyl-prolyl cis-trans isomerase [Roseibium salinum]|uniref:Peptidyl-prolyl cis-trans isomerase n=1 Tax=Roseibium salinum TaxID=1604349 RepID=A0ABT3R1W5_9HYPH|nr:FKBP-type peptidyl-prolyl cis-trans isomerase [Roseibium sp. DSM 29163]MCX2723080.1 FKBP-type peptidyl-prolyl cis-trans isomerase [Roseibium sp. DSM 29163]